MKIVNPQTVLDQLEGATVVSSHVEKDDGMHIAFQDGRILVIAGIFAISLVRMDVEKLH